MREEELPIAAGEIVYTMFQAAGGVVGMTRLPGRDRKVLVDAFMADAKLDSPPPILLAARVTEVESNDEGTTYTLIPVKWTSYFLGRDGWFGIPHLFGPEPTVLRLHIANSGG